MNTMSQKLAELDPEIQEVLDKELGRQRSTIEMIASENFASAAEAWFELSNEVKTALWKAPTKGGCFTKIEREIIKSSDFRKLHYNEGESE